MTPQTISHLIDVRNNLDRVLNGMIVKLTKEEVRAMAQRIALLDRTIVDASLAPDLLTIAAEPTIIRTQRTFTSTQDTKDIVDGFVKAAIPAVIAGSDVQPAISDGVKGLAPAAKPTRAPAKTIKTVGKRRSAPSGPMGGMGDESDDDGIEMG